MKKIAKITVIISIILALVTMFSIHVIAAEETESVYIDGVGTFSYTVENDEITITKFETDKTARIIEIPSEYEGMKVTKIGNNAFKDVNRYALAKVVIPDTVTYIGNHAFYDKTETEIILPDTLKYIGNYAFYRCWKMTTNDLYIPEGAEYIGHYAFEDANLNSITIADQENFKMGAGVFDSCSSNNGIKMGNFKNCNLGNAFSGSYFNSTFGDMENVTIGNGFFFNSNVRNVTFGNMKNVTFGEKTFGACSNLKTVTFGDLEGLTMGKEAFSYTLSKLESVTFGNMKDCTFEENTFMYCEKLTNLEFGTCENVIFGEKAFYKSGLVNVEFPSGINFGWYAFSECPNLETAVVGNDDSPRYLFYKCPVLKEITFTSCDMVGYYALAECPLLEKVNLGVATEIDSYAFLNCTSLKEVNFNNKLTIKGASFKGCTSLEYFDFSKVNRMSSRAFMNCTSLNNVDLSNIKAIPQDCFANCTSLDSIDLANLTHINDRAFAGCTSLKEIRINHDMVIRDEAFSGCTGLEKIIIEDNVTTLKHDASNETVICYDIFEGCTNVKYIYIGANLLTTVSGADFTYLNSGFFGFYNLTGLEKIEVSPENPYFFTDDNVLYLDEGDLIILLCYPQSKQGEYYSTEKVLENVTKDFTIGSHAFFDTKYLKEVEFTKPIIYPEFLNDEESAKFYYDVMYFCFGYSSVEKITFPENGLKTIPRSMFEESQIREIDLSGVEKIKIDAFMNCKNLETVDLSSCTVIEYRAFCGSGIKSVNAPLWVPEKQTIIETLTYPDFVFANCKNLETANLPLVEFIPERTFKGCENLKTVSAPKATYAKDYAFSGCSSLETVDMPLKYAYKYSFEGCSSLKNIDTDNLRIAYEYAFSGCSSLTNLKLYNATNIKNNAFQNCTGLTLAQFSNNDCTFGANAFLNCPELSFYCDEESDAYDYAVAYDIDILAIKVSFQNDTYEYTGSKIEPSVIVSVGETALSNNQDYELIFENNTKVGSGSVTVHFVGAFEGLPDAVRLFSIIRADITKSKVEYVVDNEYTGEEIRPKVVVKYGDKTLVEDVNYTIKYNSGTNAGSMFFTINGKGNYQGSLDCYYNIIRCDIAEATVVTVPDMVYTGEQLKPKPVLTWKGFTLIENEDYEIRYFDNIESGYGTMAIYGMGNFCGTQRVQFKIFGKNIENAVVSEIPEQIYTGNEITPDVTVTLGDLQLVKDTDYVLKYENNIEKGVATVLVSGIGNYSGVAKQTFNINKNSVYSFTVFSETEMTATYDGTPLKPEMEVYYGTTRLTEDVDYKVELENNVNAGTATVTIIGMGVYEGERSYNFTILPCEITENDVSVTNNGATEPEITIVKNGETLVNGKDFTVAYSNNNGTGTATINGIGNYCETVEVEYTITEDDNQPDDPNGDNGDNGGNDNENSGENGNDDNGGKLSFWQRLINFFKRLFGIK
ncbi:MAG: leucine-rich repeat domain-containing protein [Clostridia bacterium]|nr:leucine-rich repeat domain-containing protein [Clostridia bacterium]